MAKNHIYTPTSLNKLNRHELQGLAKANNIKANQSNHKIVEQLCEEARKKDPKGRRKRDDDEIWTHHPKRIASSSSSNPAARRIAATSHQTGGGHHAAPLHTPTSHRRSKFNVPPAGPSKPKESTITPVLEDNEDGEESSMLSFAGPSKPRGSGNLFVLPSAGPSMPKEPGNLPAHKGDEDGEELSLLQINVMNKMLAVVLEMDETKKVLNGLHRKAKYLADSSHDYYCKIRSEEARCERLRSYILAYREFRDEKFVGSSDDSDADWRA